MNNKNKCTPTDSSVFLTEWMERISELKRQKNAIILAHYYTLPEIQQIADFTGDSLALSAQAAKTDAAILLFAGVHFMAETAKILAPEKKVLLPEPQAGCSLADSCTADHFADFLRSYPDHTVVSYVNTSVGVKALTDICCTSGNADEVVRSLPEDEKIVFAPDRNLGRYIQKITGRKNMVIWDGACEVHERFTAEKIFEMKQRYPQAKVLAHPECKEEVLAVTDVVGSTAVLLKFASSDPCDTFLVVTESGILFQMQQENPNKRFIPVPPAGRESGCNECEYMKMVTLEKIYRTLLDESPEVILDEAIRRKAERSIQRMLEIKRS